MTNHEIKVLILAALCCNIKAHNNYYERHNFYYLKHKFYTIALNNLKTKRHSNIDICHKIVPDQNGYISELIYFTFTWKGEVIQISFHNPSNDRKELGKFYGKRTSWDKIYHNENWFKRHIGVSVDQFINYNKEVIEKYNL